MNRNIIVAISACIVLITGPALAQQQAAGEKLVDADRSLLAFVISEMDKSPRPLFVFPGFLPAKPGPSVLNEQTRGKAFQVMADAAAGVGFRQKQPERFLGIEPTHIRICELGRDPGCEPDPESSLGVNRVYIGPIRPLGEGRFAVVIVTRSETGSSSSYRIYTREAGEWKRVGGLTSMGSRPPR